MKLSAYHEKRKFDKTPEPKGKMAKTKGHTFVVQKHAASHLHYDFRLEINGVLKSWAIPKGPCLDPSVKRLAVEVEDHPLEYGNFEGVIPKGNYGGGAVMLWDKGTWAEHTDKKQTADHLSFELHGEKLHGIWKLIRIKDDPKNWLLIKGRDDQAIPQEEYDIVSEQTLSVVSGRSIQEIASDKNVTWEASPKSKIKKKSIEKIVPDFKALGFKKSKLPLKIAPQLTTLVDTSPEGRQWLHEMKYDGYRLLTHIQTSVRLLTRNNLDWTEHFKKVAGELKKLKLKNTILDGEIIALDETGQPSFQNLQNTLAQKAKAPLIYYIFDILYYEGFNVSKLPLIQRKALLEQLLPLNNPTLRYSDHIVGQGPEIFEKACELGFEGIISKKCESPYKQKRTQSWLKIKCHRRQEFVVGGCTHPKESRAGFGSLLIGYYEQNEFKYCGRVGTGFSDETLEGIYLLLQKNKTKTCPFSTKPPGLEIAFWVKPQMVIEVEFSEWTSERVLRHPSFKGIRHDKKAKTIGRETSHAMHSAIPKIQPRFNFRITHPERIVYPQKGISKLEIAKYYANIQEWILPFVSSRPLSIVRCPDGVSQACFFQKHITSNTKNQHIFQGEKYLYIENLEGLMELIQIGTLELHAYGNQIDKPQKPDMITFDLDPGPGISWKKIMNTAFLVKSELEHYGLISFVKTTGGKGLHVVVPISRRYDWEYISLFSKTFSEYLVNKYPKDYTNVMTKSLRANKIYIDYLRNKEGASAIAPYSTRAKEKATVSVPLSWEELNLTLKTENFTLETVQSRLAKLSRDPWEGFFSLKQSLPKV